MVDILTQRFSYASITPFKDYCHISDRKKLTNQFNDLLDLLDEEDSDLFKLKLMSKELQTNKKTGKIYSLPQKKKTKKKTHYFTTNEEIQQRISFDYLYSDKNGSPIFDTTSDRHIKNHYGRAFSEINVTTIERSVRLHGDKLTIKLYVHTKSRHFNCIYFKKRFDVQSLTINLKTGNFITTVIGKSGKQNSTQFRTNSFRMLKMIISESFFEPKNYVNTNSIVYNEFKKVFDDNEFTKNIQKSLGIVGCVSYSSNTDAFLNDFTQKFIELKKIKVPNGDVEFWINNFYPTEKFLKKNGRKLIASILDMFSIKSKYTIKILHEYPNIDLIGLVKFCTYFGNDYTKYIANLNPIVFENSCIKRGVNIDFNSNKFYLKNMIRRTPYLIDVEKENLIRIANSQNYRSEGILSERFIQLFDDHFSMIEKIREYDPKLYMKSKTLDEFNLEHTELTKMVTAIKKGWVIEYKFSERMVNDVEKPIPLKVNVGTQDNPVYGNDLGISFYPVILKREEEYIEEGNFMHHCVATYADKDKSIIISLRTEDSSDRVTCEFDCQTGTLIQSRHFCNKQPPADMEYVINNDLSKKMKSYARLGLLHASEKLKSPIKINGIEVKKKEPSRLGDDFFFDYMNI